MKSVSKKGYLLGLSLLWLFLIVWFISITNWSIIINTTPDDSEHRAVLHSLYLDGNVTGEALMWTVSESEDLNILNWLSVWWEDMEWFLSSILWGRNNKVSMWTFWGIWWWQSNHVYAWLSSAIAGGLGNSTRWNNSLVVWWTYNQAHDWWVVLWWFVNQAHDWWVVLGGQSNFALWENSLVLWFWATWYENSFAWNGEAVQNTARIDSNSWVLVWTYNPIEGVSLVVGWSVKLGNGRSVIWGEINFNWSWCMTMYDGRTSHVLGKKSSKNLNCGTISWCWFGRALLQNWDIVVGYTESYSTNCSDKRVAVQCNNWNLLSPIYPSPVYPYCYEGSSASGWGWWEWGWWDDCNLCDFNWDWKVDVEDINLRWNCINGIMSWNPPSYCDINWDGEINIADITSLPSCEDCALNAW